jgi:hypothetical protein
MNGPPPQPRRHLGTLTGTISLLLFSFSEVPAGRKSAGTAERRFRLSHFTIDQSLISRAA